MGILRGIERRWKRRTGTLEEGGEVEEKDGGGEVEEKDGNTGRGRGGGREGWEH